MNEMPPEPNPREALRNFDQMLILDLPECLVDYKMAISLLEADDAVSALNRLVSAAAHAADAGRKDLVQTFMSFARQLAKETELSELNHIEFSLLTIIDESEQT